MKKINASKIGLFMKNNFIINRSIPLIIFIVVLILGSIIGAMTVSDVEMRYDNIHYSFGYESEFDKYQSYRRAMDNLYDDLLGMDGAFSIVFLTVTLIVAFLSALSLTSYMRDKSASDFYHSISVNRGEIYLANYLTALVTSGATLILSQLAGLFFMDLIADYRPMSFFEMIAEQAPVMLTQLLFLALFLALAFLSTLAAGNAFAAIVNYLSLNFLAPATILAVSVSGDVLFYSNLSEFLQHHPASYTYTSPFIRYVHSAMGYYTLDALSYILYALFVVLLLLLGISLYKAKKNENSKNTLPFTKTVRPLQYILTFDAILLGATFFEAITDSPLWCFIGGFLALFFSFIAYNAFVEKSFNSVFRRSRHMAFIAIFTLIVGFVFVADAFGIYKKPEPNVDKITEAYINVSISYDDRNEHRGFDFTTKEEDANEWKIKIKEEDVEVLKKMYSLLPNSNRSYVKEEPNVTYMSVSMGISCENDFSSYHTYAYVPINKNEYQELYSMISYLIENYSHDENIYFHEAVEK